jgi:PAS domain S-box-containing protein
MERWSLLRNETAVLAIAVLLGLLVGLADTLLDYWCFYEGTFWELAITNVPAHEVYVRILILISFGAFGLVAAVLLARQRKAEAVLRESEERHRALVEACPDGIVQTDTQGKVLYASPRAAELCGCQRAEEMVGVDSTELLVPEERPRAHRDGERLAQMEPIRDVAHALLRRDGRTLAVEMSAAPVLDSTARVTSFIGIVRDVTERNRSANELQAEKDFADRILDNVVDTIFLFDPETGKPLRWNRAFREVSGFSDEEIAARKAPHDWYSAEDLQEAAEAVGRLQRGERPVTEISLITKDGRSVPTEYTASTLEDPPGHRRCVLAVGRDLSERKRMEEALRAQIQRNTQLLETTMDGYILADTEGRIIDVNPAYCQMVGYGREQLLSMNIPALEAEDSPEEVRDRIEEIIKCGSAQFQTRHRRRDGRLIDLDVSITTVTSDERTLMAGFLRDSTDRRRAEERFRLAAQVASDLIYEWDVQGDSLEWFGPLDEALGYRAGEIPRTIAGWVRLIHPEDRTRLKDSVERHRTSAEPIREDYRVQRRDGSWRHWIDHGTPILDKQGRPVKWIGACRDVTEHREAEAALRDSEERFRSLFEHAQDGILLADPATRQLRLPNPAMCQMLGYGSEEFRKLRIDDIHPPADLPYVIDQFEKQSRGELVIAVDIPLKRKDGTVVYTDVASASVQLTGGDAVLGQFRDVTERKRTQDELQVRVQQLSALNSLSHRVNSRLDPDDVVKFALEDVVERLATDMAVLFLRHDGQLDLAGVCPNAEQFPDKKIPVHRVGQCLCGLSARTGQPVYSRDIAKDPRCSWEDCKRAGFRSFASLPLVSGEEVFGVMGIASLTLRDFGREAAFLETLANEIAAGLHNARLYTEVQRHSDELADANEQVRRLNAELEQRVQQRTAELQSANDELEAFAYSVSHDLRAPLRAMEGFANALAEDYGDRLNAEGREYCQHIMDSAERMDTLISDLLAYSRLGRTEMHLRPVDLAAVVDEAVRQLQPELKASGATAAVDVESPPVQAHPGTLRQVISNLVANALKFVGAGVTPHVRVWSEVRGGFVRLWVEDNGIGVAAEHHARIFDVFERLHGIENYPGTGIGLAIVQRATARMGGRCGLVSELGKGSHFWVEYALESEDELGSRARPGRKEGTSDEYSGSRHLDG